MAYDEILALRFRAALDAALAPATARTVAEKRMMGGLCFMVGGHMIGGVDRDKAGSGRFMFRVGKANEAEALSRPGAVTVEMGGRRMAGFIFVDEAHCGEATLKGWIALAIPYVTSLPPK